MTLSEARTELAARGFDYLSAGRMTTMLNHARNAFEDVWPFPWLWKSLVGPAPLTIPDLKYMMLVKNTVTDDELLGLDLRVLGEGGTDLQLPGYPQYWWLDAVADDNIVHVWPVSLASLSVAYVSESPELVDALDEPLIPVRYQSIWIDFAVVQAYKDSDNFTAAQALNADINARMVQVVERYETRNRQNSQSISRRVGSFDD